ncbi:chromatin remodelling complex Rsc7/Swp82 subunit-domain-containing protein [Auriculariales sp. MPI-PUGE-AT-0066]|nr:chromatin remodelling complex Rsc7/Swp82 subunit-domain-containing protein [Auriculariales sp. MPI-PUGE-AT-0066]
MASSSKLRIRPPAPTPITPLPKVPKIVLRTGRAADDDITGEGSELTSAPEDDVMDQDADGDNDGDGDDIMNDDEDGAGEEEDITQTDLVEPAAPTFNTPRPRGRPRGSGAQKPRGTGRPRGRPRGSRARGPSRAKAVVWRPASNDRDSPPVLDDDSPTSTPAAWEEPVDDFAATGRSIRKIKGETYYVENEELVTPNDENGDEKITEFGVLQGGRAFKAVTFTIPTRPEPRRHYMLAIDAARTSGFRDSLYFFRRNPLMLKLNMTQAEKEALIDGAVLSPHLRSRSVTMVTARSAFKLQGAKMIRDGRWVIDDYNETQARADTLAKGLNPGDPVGELPDPQGSIGFQGSIYKSGGPTTFFGGSGMGVFAADGEPAPGRARRPTADILKAWDVLGERWMHDTAEAVSDSNDSFKKMRTEALTAFRTVPEDEAKSADDAGPLGVYEPHSGLVLYRANSQPSRTTWTPVPPQESNFRAAAGGTKAGNSAWGLARIDYVMETTSARVEAAAYAAARHREVAEALEAEARARAAPGSVPPVLSTVS